MGDLYLKRALRPALEPMDDSGADALRSLPVGATVKVKLSRPRSLPHHRWFWALCALVAENSERTPEEVATLLKLATGHRDTLPLKADHCPHCGGEVDKVAYIPKSIAFAKMDETEFAEFTKRCVQVVVTRLLPGVEAPILRAEIEAMLA